MKVKIVVGLAITTFFILLVGGLALTTFGPKPTPAQQTSLTTAKGFWQNIHTENDEHEAVSAPAFFCNGSGEYKGHIIDSGSGWWIVYQSEKKLGSYASEAFAKKNVEDSAECK